MEHLGITKLAVETMVIVLLATMDVLFSAAQSAAPNLVPGSSSRPADILLPNWGNGRSAALDVDVISPL